MAAGRAGYTDVLGGGDRERDRLVAQASALEPEARSLLDRIGVRPGWRAVDIGAGPIGILGLLSECVGPTGEVVGVDEVERFVDMAKDIVAERGLANVRLVRADARASGLPAASFELVHERLVLIGPDRDEIAAAMVDLACPGGFVVAQEIDVTSSFCEPTNPACERLLEAFVSSVRRIGAEPGIGRQLGAVLTRAGACDVVVDVTARLEVPRSPRRAQLPALVRHAREGIVRAGLLTDAELDELVDEALAHHADPATLVFGGLLFQAWGRRPAE